MLDSLSTFYHEIAEKRELISGSLEKQPEDASSSMPTEALGQVGIGDKTTPLHTQPNEKRQKEISDLRKKISDLESENMQSGGLFNIRKRRAIKKEIEALKESLYKLQLKF